MERTYVAKKDIRTIFGGLICIKGTKVKIVRECSLGITGKGITLDDEKQEFYFSTKKGFEKNFEEIKAKEEYKINFENNYFDFYFSEAEEFTKDIVKVMLKHGVKKISAIEKKGGIEIIGERVKVSKLGVCKQPNLW